MVLGLQNPRYLHPQLPTGKYLSSIQHLPRLRPRKTQLPLGNMNYNSHFKSGGQEFSTLLVNQIAVNNLEPGSYQKHPNGYEVGSIDWSAKDMYNINIDLALIGQLRDLSQNQPSPVSVSIRYFWGRRRQTTTPQSKGQHETTFSMSHILFR